MQKVFKIIYEGIMIILVIITIMTIWTENTYNSTINWIVWGVFLIDFFIRLFTATSKWDFIKKNPFLLIAIIPFDQFFQIARIVRIFYYFRIKTIAKYYITPYVKKINVQSLFVIGLLLMTFLMIEAVVLWRMEGSVSTLLDGLYVTFGHLLFFGHQIFVIEMSISIWLLTLTSIIGIVVQGLALQWAFSKIEEVYTKFKQHRKKDSSKVG